MGRFHYLLCINLFKDYVLILGGAWLGFAGDDMNKFLWMIRIAEAEWPTEVRQKDFFTKQGRYEWRTETVSETMKSSIMYRMSYNG